MSLKTEIWKELEFNKDYFISNLGRVKSIKYGKIRILKNNKSTDGYLYVVLSNKIKTKCYKVHRLCAYGFLEYDINNFNLVIHHIDSNKENNNLINLEVTTQRDNIHKKNIKCTSKLRGVSWCKKSKKWRSQIYLKKVISLGFYNTELEASNAYEKALKNYKYVLEK